MALARESAAVVIRTDRRAVLLQLLPLAVLMVAFSVFLWIMIPERYFPYLLVGLLATWLYLVRSPLRILVTGDAFVLTDRGVLAHVGSVDFVAWDEIETATIGWSGIETIDLDLRDTEAVLRRLSVLRRAALRAYIKDGGKAALGASFGQGGAEHLLELMQTRIAAGRGEPGKRVRARPARAPRRPLDAPDADVEPGELLTKPFAVMFAIAAVVFAVGMAIALYVYRNRGQDWDATLFALVGLAAIVVAFGVLPLYTGRVEWERGTFYRGKNPIAYWSSVVTIVLAGLVFFLGGIGVLGWDASTQ